MDVTARERLPDPYCPVACAEVGGEASELEEEVDDCLLVTWRFTAPGTVLPEARPVGEKAARDGLPLALGGLLCPELVVDMGVRPRREPCRGLLLLHAELCGLVLLEPLVGLSWAKGGSLAEEEGGGGLIDTARTLRAVVCEKRLEDGNGRCWFSRRW